MHYGFGGFGMILFWVVFVAAIALVVKALIGSGDKRTTREKTPLDILKDRYAAGEITRSEFEEIKHDLVERQKI